MDNSIWYTIADTPWWVYAGALYIIYYGCCATRPRLVAASGILIFPTILLIGSIISLCLFLKFSFINLTTWTFALLAGALLGWLHYQYLAIKATPDKTQLYIPGNWSVLILLFCVFTADYLFANELTHTTQHSLLTIVLYGLFTGIFLGRSSYLMRCLRTGPYQAYPNS